MTNYQFGKQVCLKILSRLIVTAAIGVPLAFNIFSGIGIADEADARAHSMLTDGIRGAETNNWLTLWADSLQLPQDTYDLFGVAYWGFNAPDGIIVDQHPERFALLRDAHVRGVRYSALWGNIQQYGPNVFNWSAVDYEIDQYLSNGFTVQFLMDYTPAWANGMRGREFPANKSVEQELINFNGSDIRTLQKNNIFVSEPDFFPLVVTPDPAQTIRYSNELISNAFHPGDQPRPSHWPIVVGSEQVDVDENDGRGFRRWTRVDNLINSPDGAEHYMIDRAGRVKFRNNAFAWFHGRIPNLDSKVRISYDAYSKVYEKDVDYTLDPLTGNIKRESGSLAGQIPQEDFKNAALDSRWHWINPPSTYVVNTSGAGMLHYPVNSPMDGIGHFLFQNVSGAGNFTFSVRCDKFSATNTSQTGIMVYQDANNWFRYAVTSDQGRPYLTTCVNGTTTVYGKNGELGWMCLAPRWVTIRRVGNTFSVFNSVNSLSGPDTGYSYLYTFHSDITLPMKIGISSSGIDPVGVDIDQTLFKEPQIPANSKVRVCYSSLDIKPWTDYLRAMVSHFKDRIKYYEIYNEPDQGWCWKGGPQLYAIWLREASKAIKETDPEARVISGGVANGSTTMLQTVYDTIGNTYFDYAAWHPYLYSNKSPDTSNWEYSESNNTGRAIMTAEGDAGKDVFFGEFASSSGVTAYGGGMYDWKQAEYGTRLLLHSRHLGWCKTVQWWPVIDLDSVGSREDNYTGAHDGLFYANGKVKPMYYALKNIASNKGILLDLGSYDSSNNLIPASGHYTISSVVIGVKDRADVAGIKVLTSLTNTDNSSKPEVVATRPQGQSNAAPFTVNVNINSANLRREIWTATAVTPLTFLVSGSVSGPQGTAVVGTPFISSNGVVSFIIPFAPNAFVVGDKFVFHTFAGDGYNLAAEWTNGANLAQVDPTLNGTQSARRAMVHTASILNGPGDIVINLPTPSDARYIEIQFTKAAGASSIQTDEVQILDSTGANVGAEKRYVVDGYQDAFRPASSTVNEVGQASVLPDGTNVTILNCVLYMKRSGFGYVTDISRAAGIRVEGAFTPPENATVTLNGTLDTTPGGERLISIASMTQTGSQNIQPLYMSQSAMKQTLANGLYVVTCGKVMPGSIQSNSFLLNDGSSASGLKIITASAPSVQAGDMTEVRGAAGFDGTRIIYAK